MFEWMHETVLEATPASVAVARRFVDLHLSAHQLPHLVDDVRLVASELATNAVEHARTAFAVALEQEHGSVVLTVRDGSALHPTRGHPDLFDVSGRGLLLVASLSQAWGIRRSDELVGKSVWASFPCTVGVDDVTGS
jgi:anti-sigma regulatory factor (Ser/Thr protein kinase)